MAFRTIHCVKITKLIYYRIHDQATRTLYSQTAFTFAKILSYADK